MPYLLRECRHLETVEDWWPRAVAVTFDDHEVLALEPTDQLIYTCTTGCRGNSPSALLWAADAWRIIKGAPQRGLDWDYLLTAASRLRLGPLLAGALSFLQQALSAAIPGGLVDELSSLPFTPAEGRYFRLNAAQRGWWGEFQLLVADHARQVGHGQPSGLGGFLQFLRDHWSLGEVGLVPGHAVRRLFARLLP
jgi:hypothetical protein